MQYQYDVLGMHANDVEDELFQLKIPAGTEVVDFSQTAVTADGVEQPLMYQMPANPAELDSLVRNTRNIVESFTTKTPDRTRSRAVLIFINAILVLSIVVAILRRRPAKQ
jgi:hypothetical protein